MSSLVLAALAGAAIATIVALILLSRDQHRRATRAATIQAVARRWRVDQDWWRQRVWREYFKLTTRTGLLVIIYRDLLSGRWYLQRLYD